MTDTKKLTAKAAKSRNLRELPMACASEPHAVEFFERQRWGIRPTCPHCQSRDVYQMKNRQGERRSDYRWRCKACEEQYTVRFGTILEDSKVPLNKWAHAFWAICASKKGKSALQLQRELGVNYRTALFMAHRIRWAMAPANDAEGKLTGTVEFDETYVGGKHRRPQGMNAPRRPSDYMDKKVPVIAGLSRGGRVKARVVTDVTPKTLSAHVYDMVDHKARLITDDARVYQNIGSRFRGGHETVNHSQREYVRGDITTNGIESFFALLKRGVIGTFHAVSRKHLHRYVSEFQFRYNSREEKDGARTRRAIRAAVGRRLTYADQLNG